LSRRQAEALKARFAEFHPELTTQALADFSGLRRGVAEACMLAPRTAADAARIVRLAHDAGVPLRIRAQGHSLNGSSLPAAGELLVATGNFRHIRFDAPGTVTAGGGVVLWLLQQLLRGHGFDLPVLNDGYAGPSVGGYVAAGGFGPRSARYGGFWDNVLELRLIDGRGEVIGMTCDDARFPWLFGAMGQLGLVVEAKLAIVPLEPGAAPPYPAGAAFSAPQLPPQKPPPGFASGADEGLFWFTLLTPDEHLDEAHEELAALERRHEGALRFQERYNYPIRRSGRMPPLLYPRPRAVTATGAWGWLRGASAGSIERLLAFDGEFMALAAGRPYFRRYVQSELPQGPAVCEACLGGATYAALRGLKAALDPRSIFNRGSVFPA
jgi:FAD/FMN-containing dehydrogenase